MSIKVYNTLTSDKEDLKPRDDGKLTMYTCGPTVYDSTHAGHLIPPVIGDVIKRYLQHVGYRVTWAHNFTDVEDKIIRRAREEGVSAREIAERYIGEYLEVMDALGVDTVDVYPRVSEHMDDIVDMIQGLIDRGHAYESGGDAYFDVTSFPDYGKLSHRSLEELQTGARVEVDGRKRHPADFALWKAAKPGEPSWESPWGAGRPGWHIECSVMAAKHLGYPVDLHGGGVDLVFPHHENEIAQSEAHAGEGPFVRYWLHSGLLQLKHEKMSKSLGNFVRAVELLERYGPYVVRYYILAHHYRSPREFGKERLEEARRAWERLRHAVSALRGALEAAMVRSDADAGGPGTGVSDRTDPVGDGRSADGLIRAARGAERRWDAAMSDDFNTAEAVASLFELSHASNAFINRRAPAPPDQERERASLRAALDVFETANDVLRILPDPDVGDASSHDGRPAEVAEALIRLLLDIREEAREERDWVRADRIRDRLGELGVIVEDTPQGPRHRWEAGA